MSTEPVQAVPVTKREQQIIGLVGEGLSYQDIALRLQTDINTVKGHVHDILEKLGFRTRLEIAAYARRNGRRSVTTR